jgi:hypothetical protein
VATISAFVKHLDRLHLADREAFSNPGEENGHALTVQPTS